MKAKEIFSKKSRKTFSTILMVVFFVFDVLLSLANIIFLVSKRVPVSDSDMDLGVEENYFTSAYSNTTVIVVVTVSAVMILTSVLCLISTIRNIKSEYKPVKIINKALTFFFIAAIVWGIAAIGLLNG